MYGRNGPKLRVIHNVADAPNVDVKVVAGRDEHQLARSRPVLKNVPYKAISGYLELPITHGNSYAVGIKPKATADVGIRLDPNTFTTAIVHGLLADKSVNYLFLADDSSCPEPGMAHLRFVHAAATVPDVDVYARPSSKSRTTPKDRILSDISYGQSSKYLPVPAGSYRVDVKPAGGKRAVLSADLVLKPETIYTVVASGLLKDAQTPLTALVTTDNNDMCIML